MRDAASGTPHGSCLASGSRDGAVRLWTARPAGDAEGAFNDADCVVLAHNF